MEIIRSLARASKIAGLIIMGSIIYPFSPKLHHKMRNWAKV